MSLIKISLVLEKRTKCIFYIGINKILLFSDLLHFSRGKSLFIWPIVSSRENIGTKFVLFFDNCWFFQMIFWFSSDLLKFFLFLQNFTWFLIFGLHDFFHLLFSWFFQNCKRFSEVIYHSISLSWRSIKQLINLFMVLACPWSSWAQPARRKIAEKIGR